MSLIVSHLEFALSQIKKDTKLDPKRARLFILGNILPDIRHLTGEPRAKWHLDVSSVNEFSSVIHDLDINLPVDQKVIWIAIAFHSFVDNWWRDQVWVASKSPFVGKGLQILDEYYALLEKTETNELLLSLNSVDVPPFLSDYRLPVEKAARMIVEYIRRFSDLENLSLLWGKQFKLEKSQVDELWQLVHSLSLDTHTINKITSIRSKGIPLELFTELKKAWTA